MRRIGSKKSWSRASRAVRRSHGSYLAQPQGRGHGKAKAGEGEGGKYLSSLSTRSRASMEQRCLFWGVMNWRHALRE